MEVITVNDSATSYINIPLEILRDDDLTAKEKIFVSFVLYRCQSKHHCCFDTTESMAEIMGGTARSYTDTIERIIAKGYIRNESEARYTKRKLVCTEMFYEKVFGISIPQNAQPIPQNTEKNPPQPIEISTPNESYKQYNKQNNKHTASSSTKNRSISKGNLTDLLDMVSSLSNRELTDTESQAIEKWITYRDNEWTPRTLDSIARDICDHLVTITKDVDYAILEGIACLPKYKSNKRDNVLVGKNGFNPRKSTRNSLDFVRSY
jgi:hypothetical protein